MSSKHVCMLPTVPSCLYSMPTAGVCGHIRCRLRRLLLPCAWHHGSALFIRSQKSLKLEQHRQIASGHKFIWHPYSPLKIYWDLFSFFVNFVAFIYMPLQVFIPCSDPYDMFVLFSDSVFFFEIIVNFITGRVDEDHRRVILEPRIIAMLYIRGSFIFDLIGCLPLQIIQPFQLCEFPTHTIFYMFKLFRIVTLKRLWRNCHEQFDLSYMSSGIIALIGQAVIFFHWITYIHYQVPSLCAHVYPFTHSITRWLARFKVLNDPPATLMDKYTTNLYYVTGLCIGAGMYSPVEQHVLPELLLTASLGIIGLLFMIYGVTALIRLVVYKHFESYLYNGRLKELMEYLSFKRMPPFLQQKIQLFINYKFNGHYFNEASILQTVNEQIKQDINMFCCKRLVANVPLFQNLPIALMNMIIFNLTQILYMPGDVVVKCGHPGSSIYMIASGTVACTNAAGKEVAHLKDGAFFGEQALMHPGTPRAATVIALEITEMYKLTHKQFESCLQLCPRMKRRLAEGGERPYPRPPRPAPRQYTPPPAPLVDAASPPPPPPTKHSPPPPPPARK